MRLAKRTSNLFRTRTKTNVTGASQYPAPGDNALSVEGRFDRQNIMSPTDDDSNEWGVQVSFGQRIAILR